MNIITRMVYVVLGIFISFICHTARIHQYVAFGFGCLTIMLIVTWLLLFDDNI